MTGLESEGHCSLDSLHDGCILVESSVKVSCVAPTAEEVETLLGKASSSIANEMSLVLEVQFGATRLVLGGDLPWKAPDGLTVVASGWHGVLERHARLAEHQGLKIPHHASLQALHPTLVAPAPAKDRSWICAPFELQGLPDFGAGQGVEFLLQAEPRLHLTKLPRRAEALSAVVTLSEMRTASAVPASGGRPIKPIPPKGPLAAVWCVAFDNNGGMAGRWRGPAAVEVVP